MLQTVYPVADDKFYRFRLFLQYKFKGNRVAPKLLSPLNGLSCWKVVVLLLSVKFSGKMSFSQLTLLRPLNIAFAYLFLVRDT